MHRNGKIVENIWFTWREDITTSSNIKATTDALQHYKLTQYDLEATLHSGLRGTTGREPG